MLQPLKRKLRRLRSTEIMFQTSQLFTGLLLFFLLILGFWGLRKILVNRSPHLRKEPENVLKAVDDERLAAVEPELIRTYFRGLSYVLANETDKAVAEFVKVAQVDTTTAEIYLALGQLFRKSGEVERVIRVHRDILLRPNLPDDIRQQTFFEIGLDYKKAGFFDRACCTFEEILDHNPKDLEAHKELSELYVNMKEWEKALDLHNNSPASQSKTNIIAHLTTEVAKTADRVGDKEKANTLYQKAIEIDGKCVDAWLHYGDFLLDENRHQDALAAWEKAFSINHEFTDLVIDRFAKLPAPEQKSATESFFRKHQDVNGERRRFNLAYISWQIESGMLLEARLRLKAVLEKTDGDSKAFTLAHQLLIATQSAADSDQNIFDTLVNDIFSAKFRFEKEYHCQKCGYKLDNMTWKCPRCSSWDSVTRRS